MSDLTAIVDFINQGTNFAVISHTSPDGDTMGSAAALIYALKKMGKHAQWYCDGEVAHDFMKLEQIASLVNGEKLKKYDSIICVDCASSDRLGKNEKLILNFDRVAQIDHHVTNTEYAKVNFVRERSANCFNILAVIKELGVELDTDMARSLYVGICTDTGRLSYSGVSSQDVSDTAELYNYDLRPDIIISTLFWSKTLARTKISGRAIDHIRTAMDGKITYTYLDAEDYSEFNATSADSEGVIEYCRNVEGTELAFFVRQTVGGYKVSMRAKFGYDLTGISTKHGGGGHPLAAGCAIDAPRDEVIKIILKELTDLL